ncbi:MAG: hypothetical protein K8T89_04025 [Planctomycetes bacterium]|nr:hypothetical protein [Planctomycetota bacterium]
MKKPTWEDAGGFVIAAVITTTPLFAVTWLGDNLSKDGPIGLPAYLLPAAIGIAVAFIASLVACQTTNIPSERLEFHTGFGCAASLLLIVTICVWWGDWCFRFAGRFRN